LISLAEPYLTFDLSSATRRRRDLVVKVEGSAICSSWVQPPHPIDAVIFFIDHRRAMGRLPFLASACSYQMN